MEELTEMIRKLYSKDNKEAYNTLQLLEKKSDDSNEVYEFFDEFVEMIKNDNSYIRTRGLRLIACNAKWDTENKIDEIIDEYLKHILDDKPITSRGCIKVLPIIAQNKLDLVDVIKDALTNADVSIYADSMQSLVYKDIREALKKIK